MKRSLTFCIILLAQSVLCVPVPVEEPEIEPVLRGFIDSILSAISQTTVNGLATTGDKIIASTISSGGDFLSSLMGALSSNPEIVLNSNPELESQPQIVQQDDDEMLDVLDALVDQMILDQPIVTTETIGNGDGVSHDEIGEEPDTSIYLVLLP